MNEKKKYLCAGFSEALIMKKIVFGCCLLVWLMASCGGGKKKIDPFETLTRQIDSLQVEEEAVVDTAPVRPEVIPATADESFADFFYNFASNEGFQHSRIVFPISYYKGKEVVRISKEDWKYEGSGSYLERGLEVRSAFQPRPGIYRAFRQGRGNGVGEGHGGEECAGRLDLPERPSGEALLFPAHQR